MKVSFFVFVFSMLFIFGLQAQEKTVKFTVEVSSDSILMGNYFEVKFILENAKGKNFEAPQFENFKVISGPNSASSYSMVNGNMTQSMTITYYLEPLDIGNFYILPGSVEASGKVLETAPLRVMVVPNPDGIKQIPRRQNERQSDWFKTFGFDSDFFLPFPPQSPKAQPKPEEKPVEKKKKTTRI